MTPYEETRRTGMCERASEVILGRNTDEDTASPLDLQSAWLSARYSMGRAHARMAAELAFARSPQR